MGIGRLGRIQSGSTLNHDDVRSHGGRVDGLTYSAMGLFGSDDTQRYLDEVPREYFNMYYNWANLDTRKISSNTYMSSMLGISSNADYTGPVDVAEVFFDMGTNPGAGTYRIHLAHKVTTSTTFYNDVPICGVQVLDLQGNVLETIGCPYDQNGVVEWECLTGTNSGQQSDLFSPYTRNSNLYSWSAISSSASTSRFSIASSTVSSSTGIAGGVDISNNRTNSIPFPVGFGTMGQRGTFNYIFRETSGSTLNTFCIGRTRDSYSIPRYGSIRVIHANTTISSQNPDTDQTLFVGIA